jgi:hypothetical protein
MARHKRERWYSLEGQSQSRSTAYERSSGTRRIVSLIILLALVLILIRQTSDTKKVEQIATAIGLLPNPNQDPAPQSIDSTSPEPTLVLNLDNRDWIYESIALETESQEVQINRLIWETLLKRATPSTVASLAQRFFAKTVVRSEEDNSTAKESELQSWFTDSQILLSQWSTIESQNAETRVLDEQAKVDESPISRFIIWLNTHEELFGAGVLGGLLNDSDEMLRGLKLALDSKLLDGVFDCEPWWPKERVALVRTWQRLGLLRDLLANNQTSLSRIPKVNVPQIASESHSLRGRPIRLEGTIVKLDRPQSIEKSGFGQWSYQDVWLRPNDASNQPVCVSVPVLNVDSNTKLEEGTQVVVCGFFIKRIAYASERGAEVGPAILAAYVGPTNATSTPPESPWIDFSATLTQKSSSWSPPIDYMTPFAILRNTFARTLQELSEPILQSGFQGTNISEVLKPLLELERLAPEVDLLTKNQPNWPIADNAALVRLSGLVTKVERLKVDRQVVPTLEQSFVYRCHIQSKEAAASSATQEDRTHTVVCTTVPSVWLSPDGTPLVEIRQPCSLSGVSLKGSETNFVWARSIEWRKGVIEDADVAQDNEGFKPQLSSAERFLLDHGWDLGWSDLIREMETEPIKPLSQREHEPFFALLRLANETPYLSDKIATENANKPRMITDLLESLRQKKRGASKPATERVSMNMRVVRISSIQVVDPVQVTLLGTNRYYQLDAMAEIGDRSYEIKTDKDPVVYSKEYPVTCVSIAVPSWLQETDRAQGLETQLGNEAETGTRIEQVWYPRRKASASGWFYRFWSYKTQEITQSMGAGKRQVGPLIVLDSVQRVAVGESDRGSFVNQIANGASAVIGVLGVIGIWWYVRKRTKKRQR